MAPAAQTVFSTSIRGLRQRWLDDLQVAAPWTHRSGEGPVHKTQSTTHLPCRARYGGGGGSNGTEGLVAAGPPSSSARPAIRASTGSGPRLHRLSK
jgi:hypothetical protein